MGGQYDGACSVSSALQHFRRYGVCGSVNGVELPENFDTLRLNRALLK
jgi:hypothetical protein